VTLGEFLRWLGLWFLMATMKGFSRSEYWSNAEIDAFKGPPYRFNHWMTKK
jgi:hypothetical protein